MIPMECGISLPWLSFWGILQMVVRRQDGFVESGCWQRLGHWWLYLLTEFKKSVGCVGNELSYITCFLWLKRQEMWTIWPKAETQVILGDDQIILSSCGCKWMKMGQGLDVSLFSGGNTWDKRWTQPRCNSHCDPRESTSCSFFLKGCWKKGLGDGCWALFLWRVWGSEPFLKSICN